MKPFRFSREGYLKGLLFLALLAQLTWEPLSHHVSQIDLSSAQGPVPAPISGQPQAGNRVDCRTQPTNAQCTNTPSAQQRTAIVQNAEKIKAQIEQAQKQSGKTTAAPDFSKDTEAKAGCTTCNQPSTTTTDQEKIDQLEQQIADIKSHSKASATASDSKASDSAANDDDDDQPVVDQVKVARCEIDTDGSKLSSVDEFVCQSKRLSKITSKDSATQKREATRRVQELYTKLRKDAKDDIFSNDADRNDQGDRTITAMLDALNKTRFDHDSDREKMVESLQGLRAGAQARQGALDLQDDVKDLSNQMKSSYRDLAQLNKNFQNSCRTRNGCDRDIFDQIQDTKSQIQDLRSDHDDLAKEIVEARDDANSDLEDYDHAVSRAEMREYTSPYSKLLTQMDDMVNPQKMNSLGNANDSLVTTDPRFNGSGQAFLDQYGLPADFFAVRGGAGAMQRTNGLYTSPSLLQPMGSPVMLNNQYQMGQYNPQYMQVPGTTQLGMPQMPGVGGSLLPPPNGMMGGSPMMPGMMGAAGRPIPAPMNGQQMIGQPYMGQPYMSQPIGGAPIPAGHI